MHIEIGADGVILCSLKLRHNGKEKEVHNLVLDTGAAEIIIDMPLENWVFTLRETTDLSS